MELPSLPMSYRCWITLQCHRSLISVETSIYWKTFSGVNLSEWGTLWEQSYAELLLCLSALSLERSRDLADLLYAYKIIHGLVGLSMDEAGISLQKGVTHSSDLRLLVLRVCTEKVKSHFKYRIATLWNDLPLSIVSIPRFHLFRCALYSHFMSKEEWIFFPD